ncbi:hypothetical protein K0B04_02165 [Patescibacteria group bacterium]|nr:hypothetical protein [Patescibacteria group bacterium]
MKRQFISWGLLLISLLFLILSIVIKNSSCNCTNCNQEVNLAVSEVPSTVWEQVNLDNLESYVKLAKVDMEFPIKVDEHLQFVDMTAEGKAIRRHFIITGADMSQVTNTDMKNVIMPDICSDADTAYFLEQGVILEYFYVVKETSQEILVSISKEDCI